MTGFGTFLMRQFFMGLPDELIEAARIDGWSEFAIWTRIAMPLVVPALSALAIFHFLGNWTAFRGLQLFLTAIRYRRRKHP